MYTKNQLMRTFSISYATVNRTLALANLPTKKRSYSDSEFQRFCKYRALLKGGYTEKQIKQMERIKKAE